MNAPVFLIVDDEFELRGMLASTFELGGFSVATAGSGNEALKTIASQAVDIVLSDFKMPKGSGLDLVRTLREAGDRRPVILMTGYADLTQAVAKQAGAFDLVSKPFDLEDLVARLRDCVARGA